MCLIFITIKQKVKHKEIKQDYSTNKEIKYDKLSTQSLLIMSILKISSILLSCDFENAINDIEDESTSYSNLSELIKYWAVVKHNITHSALTNLLHI